MSDYLDELRNAVRARAAGQQVFTLHAFAEHLLEVLEEAEVILDATAQPIVGVTGRNRKRLELLGYAHEQADDSLVLVVGLHTDDPDAVLTRTDATRIFDAGQGFLEHSSDGWLERNLEASSPAAELAHYFRKLLESQAAGFRVDRLRFVLVTDATMSERLKSFDSREVCGRPAAFEIWDLRRLEALAASESGLEDLVLDLTRYIPDGLACLPAAEESVEAHSYLAVIPGSALAAIFRDHGARLLESNVRTYLSARGKVNKGIQTTLLNEPKMFLPYNNGLTTTATDAVVSDTAGGPRLTSLTNWQIVNGGQTTSSLVHFLRGGSGRTLEDVYVQMKLVKVPAGNAADIVASVSRYANSQNKINEADFFSNSPFHQALEQLSLRLKAPAREGQQYQTGWFYERSRGQYESRQAALATPHQRKAFELEYPKSQKVTKTDWAKFAFSWSGRPHAVSRGAQANFMEYAKTANELWESKPESINDVYFRSGVAKAIIFRDLRAAVLKADWYGSGYLANIVTYAIAKLSHTITESGVDRFDFESVWRRQAVSPVALEQLMQSARAASRVLNDPDRPQANVTQWAKQEECWRRMKAVPMRLSEELKLELISASDIASSAASARADRKVDLGLAVVGRVMKVRADVWQQVLVEGVKRGFVSPSDREIIQKFARPGQIPSDRQAARMLAVLERAAGQTVIRLSDF